MLKIIIDVTTSDCEELMEGKRFDWTFQDENGQDVEVHLYNPDTDEEDEDE